MVACLVRAFETGTAEQAMQQAIENQLSSLDYLRQQGPNILRLVTQRFYTLQTDILYKNRAFNTILHLYDFLVRLC